ncbi:hypothetical protein RLIN73S_02085 [Rhodanobacter lindaniclasticus]
MQYATARVGGNAAVAVPVNGAVPDRNPNGSPRLVYGANSIEHTVQDQAKLKWASISPNTRPRCSPWAGGTTAPRTVPAA